MKLTELEPQFLRVVFEIDTWTRVRPDGTTEEVTGPREHHHYVDTLAEAQGLMFLCPKCYAANNGAVGTHAVICWFEDRGVPDETNPKPGRWKPQGTGYHDLSFVPGRTSNSVLLLGGCAWHGFLTDGNVI